MRIVHMITFALLVIGGLNWGAMGIFEMDLGTLLGGQAALASKVIYVIIGLAAIYEAVIHWKVCSQCTAKKRTDQREPDVKEMNEMDAPQM